jgi:hypothetical protein
VPDVPSIDLTPEQLRRIADFADARGLSLEDAAAQLAHDAIQARFVLPSSNAKVVPIGALKRGEP